MINKIINNKRYVYFYLTVYWIILFAATSIPSDHVPSLGVSDKFKHFGAYAVLASLVYAALFIQNRYKIFKQKPALFTIIITALYGALDEIHQSFIPGRSCELMDWVADVIGILLAVIIIKYFIFGKWKINFALKNSAKEH